MTTTKKMEWKSTFCSHLMDIEFTRDHLWLPTYFVDRLIEFRPIKTIHPLDSLRILPEEGEKFAFAYQVNGLERTGK